MKGLIFCFMLCPILALSATPNSEMKSVLKALKDQGGKPIEKLTVDQARLQPTPADAVKSMSQAKVNLKTVKDIQINGAQGKIPARLYIPEGKTPMPVVVYFHGGGWVIANNNDYDSTARSLSYQTKAIFLSVEYRKAPEAKFPAAHDDAYAAYLWVLKNAGSFGGDPKRVAVAGESAGANLAMNVSIRARDQKVQMPLHQLIVYPVAGTNMKTDSYVENKEASPLNADMMSWFMKNYLRSTEDLKDKRINLVEADLKGLPPTTIITAEIDPLRSEGRLLAERLKQQGVKVTYKDYTGVTHEFFGMAPVLDKARQAQEEASEDLRESFKL